MKCPVINKTSIEYPTSFFELGSFKMNITENEGVTNIMIEAPSIDFKANLFYLENSSEGSLWALPLDNDGNLYLFDHKKFGLPTLGTYSFKGKTYTCSEGECLTNYDEGRGHLSYHTNWFWASFATYLPDGRTFALDLGDGLGEEFTSKQKAYEDFAIIDGKHYKLD